MRLIDADALCKECIEEFILATCEGCVVKEYKLHKAIDAVPVVRCKDCENYSGTNGKDSGKPSGYGQCKWPTGIRGIVCADDYCSFGKRKDGE